MLAALIVALFKIDQLVAQLHDLGVVPGGVLIVHTSFSKVGPVEGGPEGLVAALRAALGVEGTLVMPSMSDERRARLRSGDHPVRRHGHRR